MCLSWNVFFFFFLGGGGVKDYLLCNYNCLFYFTESFTPFCFSSFPYGSKRRGYLLHLWTPFHLSRPCRRLDFDKKNVETTHLLNSNNYSFFIQNVFIYLLHPVLTTICVVSTLTGILIVHSYFTPKGKTNVLDKSSTPKFVKSVNINSLLDITYTESDL